VTVTPRGAATIWAATAAALAVFLGLTVALAFTQDSAGRAAVADDVQTAFDVTLTEFAISPATVNAPADTPLTFAVTNAGGIGHDLAIEGAAATPYLDPGAAATLAVDGLAEGTYRMYCTIAGHAEAGMEGTLVVAGDGGPASDLPHAEHSSPEEMAELHERGVAEFPVETEGQGGVPLAPDVDTDGVKVFELTASEISWETEPGKVMSGMAYNEMIPGPQLEAEVGDDVRIILHNELSVPTAMHLHGLLLPPDMDGVPGLSQPSIMPGESFTYEFTVRNSGSHMYHSHFDAAVQVPSGLLGAFIVHDPADPDVDLDYVMVLNDGPLGYTLNGKGFPATEPIVANYGETVRIRYMNEGLQIHPMHLHGMPQQVIAKDGYPLPEPYLADTVNIAPGERIDVLVEATEVGAWAFHCHILTHAEGADGMFGMVTVFVVNE
jgi:manganese oxidase